MGQLYYQEGVQKPREDAVSLDDKNYHEPNSVHISEDWDTIMEDFLDDFDDYQDINMPTNDDEY